MGRKKSFILPVSLPHQPQERTLPEKRKAGAVASFPRLLGHCHPETSILRHLEIAMNKRGQGVSISRLLGVPSGRLCRGGPHQPSSLRISTTLVDAMDPHSFYHRGSWHGAQETALQRNTTALPLRKLTASTADADAPAAFTAEGPPDFSIHRLQLPEFLPTHCMRAETWDLAQPLHPQPACFCSSWHAQCQSRTMHLLQGSEPDLSLACTTSAHR